MANDIKTITMNISLPEPLKKYVDEQVASGSYGSASEFVREVIRARRASDEERTEARQGLNRALLEGLNSGKPVIADAAFWEKKKKDLAAQVKARKRSA